jgi:hypothetical protein
MSHRLCCIYYHDSFPFCSAIVCQCDDNFDGIACERCAMGWSGEHCNISVDPIVRRDFASLSEVDKQYVCTHNINHTLCTNDAFVCVSLS